MKKKNLSELRKDIDKIDSSIVNLINERARISKQIGDVKQSRKQAIYSPDRESQVYAKVINKNKGPVTDVAIKAIYREMMSACLSLEKPMKVAYLGPECTFTHQVSMKKFGASIDYLSCGNISDVFREVERDSADYGVVPIENSTEGAVNHTLDMFMSSSLLICSESYLKIRHCLLANTNNMKSIKRIYSNPQVFGQCRIWLEKNLPTAKLRESASTAKAAEIAARHSDSGCIASELAASNYGLKIIAKGIEDNPENITRFLVIGKHLSKPSGSDKTSVMFSVKDSPGALHAILSSFKKYDINLSKIESRPSKKGLWDYYFFADMEGHRDMPSVKKSLTELTKRCNFVKVLGSYPKGR